MKPKAVYTLTPTGLILLTMGLLIGCRSQSEPTVPLTPTAVATEAEMAAEAIGRTYNAYRPTIGECTKSVDRGDLDSCVAPTSIELITQPEWEELLPGTNVYHIRLDGRNREYGRSYGYEIVAWHEGRAYTAKSFHRLLEVYDITTVNDENRELVVKALVLLTLPDYFDENEEITLSDLRAGDNLGWTLGPEFEFNYALTVRAEFRGLTLSYRFLFDGQGYLRGLDRRFEGDEPPVDDEGVMKEPIDDEWSLQPYTLIIDYWE